VGAGKSFVAQALAREGCGVINSDALAHEVLGQPETARQLVQWWGGGILDQQGVVDRKKVAARVFDDPAAVQQLNGLIHPAVNILRQQRMAKLMQDPQMRAIVWDTPLLFETGIHRECDAIIFVKAPESQRLARVTAERRWAADTLRKREKLQMALDKKEDLADYIVDNSGEAANTLHQVHQVLSQILLNQAS